MRNEHAPQGRALTLIELLGVVVIIAILAALMFPLFFARSAAPVRRDRCAGNLRALTRAMMDYARDHGGNLPSSATWFKYEQGIGRYVDGDQRFVCPCGSFKDREGYEMSYGMNEALSGKPIDKVPPNVPLLMDASKPALNYGLKKTTDRLAQTPGLVRPHTEAANVAFADARVETLR